MQIEYRKKGEAKWLPFDYGNDPLNLDKANEIIKKWSDMYPDYEYRIKLALYEDLDQLRADLKECERLAVEAYEYMEEHGLKLTENMLKHKEVCRANA